MKILKFIEKEIENEVGGTYELGNQSIEHVEVDSEDKDGVVWASMYSPRNYTGEMFYYTMPLEEMYALREKLDKALKEYEESKEEQILPNCPRCENPHHVFKGDMSYFCSACGCRFT